jgi:hypothetical protein
LTKATARPASRPVPIAALPALPPSTDGSAVVVQVIQQAPARRIVSQEDHAAYGFPTRENMLAYIRREGLPVTRHGALRLVDADELVAAIKARAKVPARKAPVAIDDDAALVAAGLRRKAGVAR